jgi:hypothetical protein
MSHVDQAKRKYHRKHLGVESGPVPLRNWKPVRQTPMGSGNAPMGAARQRIATRDERIEQQRNPPRD